jgi:transcriptional regulator with XRE-family HTH domain
MLFIEFYFVNIQDKNSIQIIFGNNLRRIRIEKGFTQEQLANELGVEISQISRIERGIINTSIATLYFISIILGVDLNDFFKIDVN